MSDILQFHCPACGITLRIPMAAAGSEGPCPRCSQIIGAPDPRGQLPPRRLSPPGSIHAMMERLSRARAAESVTPLPADAQIYPPSQGYAGYAAPAPAIPASAPVQPPHPHYPEPSPYLPPQPYQPPAQPPVQILPPAPPLEPVAVKYPPYDLPPLPPKVPDQIYYYPWDELGRPVDIAAPQPPSPAPAPPAYPAAPAAARVQIPAPVLPPAPQALRPEPPATVPLVTQRPAPAAPAPENLPKTVPIEPRARAQSGSKPFAPATTRLETPAPSSLPSATSVPPLDRSSPPFSRSQPLHSAPTVRAKPAAAPRESESSRRTILLLSCWVTGIVTLIGGFSAGYYIGNRFPLSRFQNPDPRPATAEIPPSAHYAGAAGGDLPIRVLPHVSEAKAAEIPSPPPAKEPSPKAGDSPEPPREALIPQDLLQTVRDFLGAPSRSTRMRYVLFPDRVRPKMEAWYTDHPDEAFPVKDITFEIQLQDPSAGLACEVFRVSGEGLADDLPVIAMDSTEGWRVDWESFVEFQSDAFALFANGPVAKTGKFHLALRNIDYTGHSFPGIEKLTAFRVSTPMPGRTKYAFVTTGSPLHRSLAALADRGGNVLVVLELALREASNKDPYLEITNLVASDWIPKP